MAGKPFQSKLTLHFDLIATMRRQRKSWQEIVAHLDTLGLKTDKGNLCAFFKRHRSRPAALGMEEMTAPRRSVKPASAMSSENRNLSEWLSPPSEFETDPLTISVKKKWNVIKPNP